MSALQKSKQCLLIWVFNCLQLSFCLIDICLTIDWYFIHHFTVKIFIKLISVNFYWLKESNVNWVLGCIICSNFTLSTRKLRISTMLVMSVLTYRKLNLPRTNRSDIDTNVEPGGMRFQLRGLRRFFGCSVKKGTQMREIQQQCIGYFRASAVLRRIHILKAETRELNSWQRQESCPSLDNWSPAFPEKRIDFSSLPAVSSTRCISIASYPSASPIRSLIFFVVFLRVLFLLFHDFHDVYIPPALRTRSVRRKIFFFASQRNPSSSFILTQNLSDLPFFISSFENRDVQSRLRRFHESWRSRSSGTIDRKQLAEKYAKLKIASFFLFHQN